MAFLGSPYQRFRAFGGPLLELDRQITYLGIDRLGLVRPDMALQRLIKKGALRPKKIGGHLAFDKEELDRVASRGDQVRRRGRPRKTG